MIEPLEGMPPSTLGFRATGRVTRDEYREVLLPTMREAAEAGEVRMVFAVGPGFEELEGGLETDRGGHRRRLDQEGDPHVHLAHAW